MRSPNAATGLDFCFEVFVSCNSLFAFLSLVDVCVLIIDLMQVYLSCLRDEHVC